MNANKVRLSREETHALVLDNESLMAFSSRVRKRFLLYSLVAFMAAVTFSFYIHSEAAFWSTDVLTAGLYTVPAIFIYVKLLSRVSRAQVKFWRIWFAGFISLFMFGLMMSFVTVPEWVPVLKPKWFNFWYIFKFLSALFGVLIVPFIGWALTSKLRSKSGRRAPAVDFLDVVMAIIVVLSPIVLVSFKALISHNTDRWIIIPLVAMAASMPAFGGVNTMLYLRLPKGEREISTLGIVLAIVSTFDAFGNLAEIFDNYKLPFFILIALVALNHCCFLLYPLYERKESPKGLDRLAPQNQVRSWDIVAFGVVIGVAAIIIETLNLGESISWTITFPLVVLGVLLFLATVRHILTVNETKALYLELETQAEERRVLLNNLIMAVEDDRHQMAAKLHELSLESLSTISSIMQIAYRSGPDSFSASLGDSLKILRADLSQKSEEYRQLMVAVKLPNRAEGGLESSIRASFEDIKSNGNDWKLDIDISNEVDLDWTNKTVIYQIAKEALRTVSLSDNVQKVQIRVYFHDPSTVIEVNVFGESIDWNPGLSTIRLFASLGRGIVDELNSSKAIKIVLNQPRFESGNNPESSTFKLIEGGKYHGSQD